MLFAFLKYVKPIWYLNLRTPNSSLFVDYRLLTEAERTLIDYCSGYATAEGALMDAALQAWFKGFVEPDSSRCLTMVPCCENRGDNYLFLRRFFSPWWSWYTLVVRLLTLHNPIEELRSFFKSAQASRLNLYDKIVEYPIEAAKRPVDPPLVSVVIPTLNRYKYLRDALLDLENQDYPDFEVIVVDQSDEYQESFYNEFKLNLRVFRQEEKALWLARNTAVRAANGSLILLFDDDSRVQSNWITEHVRCLAFFKADLSSGVSLSKVGGRIPKTYSHYKWSDQVDTGNVLIYKSVFEKVGLFDRQFERQRMGDAEFGLRCYLAGFRNVSNPSAFRIHLKVGEGGLRDMGGWDAFRPRNLFGPRPLPSVLYYFRRYYGRRAATYALIRDVPPSIIPYSLKRNRLMILLGFVIGLLLVPVMALQVAISWRKSSRKLLEGPKIEHI